MKAKKTDSIVITARQMLNGYTTDVDRRFLWNTSPYQILPMDEKDDDWRRWNMDWLEYVGMRDIMANNTKFNKLYDLANGVIDKSDYIRGPQNPYNDVVSTVVNEDTGPFSLKFYPLAPNIVNVLTGEFSKRDKRIIVKATDEFAINEKLEYKKELVLEALVNDAKAKAAQTLAQNGIQLDSQQGQEQMNTAALLAEAQIKFKTYRGVVEQWGQHMVNAFDDKFRMYELESLAFRDSLVVDREFWLIDIHDENLKVKVLNPKNVFYHKSPDVYYISEGNYAGDIELMSIPDVIDMFGSKLTEDQVEELKYAQALSVRGGNVVEDARKHDATQYWDASKTYDKQQPNSIHYEQYMGLKSIYEDSKNMDWNDLRNFNVGPYSQQSLVRVTRGYWRSQKKVGHLTRIKEDGTIVEEVVDELYKVTIKPIYDKSITKEQSVSNLLYGEHIDWIWIDEVWGGVKIGPNSTTYYQSRGYGFNPVYVDIGPLKFQFKGQKSLYGCKLPIEGRVFSERNSVSHSPVARIAPWQVLFNIANNMKVDRLADNVGKVFVLDQNMIPRNSMDGSWGTHNYAKFYQVMKDYKIALVDTSMQNTENPSSSFSHFASVDVSSLEEIATLERVAETAKIEAFSAIGITPQRLGSVAASETATGVQQAVNNSYSQTEPLYDQHMNHLMPRVYQMMLEGAQFLCAEYPESDINYLNRDEEQEWFKIDGAKLILSELGIYAMSKANVKAAVDRLHQLLAQNNTASDSMYELAKGLSMDSPSEIIAKLKEFDEKRQQQQEAERQQQLQLQREQQQFMEKQQQQQIEREDYWKNRELELKQYLGELTAKQPTTPPFEGEDPTLQINEQNLELRKQLSEEQTRQTELNLKNKELDLRRYEKDIELKIAKEKEAAAKVRAKGKK